MKKKKLTPREKDCYLIKSTLWDMLTLLPTSEWGRIEYAYHQACLAAERLRKAVTKP